MLFRSETFDLSQKGRPPQFYALTASIRQGFSRGRLSCNGAGILVMSGPVKSQNRYRHDRCDHSGQHDEDEPGSAVSGLGRGLRDAHGVDEGVRDEEEKLHGDLMEPKRNGSRILSAVG